MLKLDFKKIEKRRLIPSLILSFITTIFSYFGTRFCRSAFSNVDIKYSPRDIILPIVLFILFSLVFYYLSKVRINIKENENYKLKRWQIFLPLMAVSIIVLIAVFPGHYPYDASSMFYYYSSGNYTTHFSPAITWLLGTFLTFGRDVLGSMNLGHALLILLQIILTNFVITEAIFYCSNKLKNKKFAIINIIYFVFHPLIQILLIRSGQDTIFGALFLWLTLEFLKISENENYFDKKLNFVKIFFIAFFLFITRNNGLYSLIPAIIIGLFTLRIKTVRRKFFIALLLPIIAFFGYKNLIINNIVTNKDSFFQETLNIPTIQIARSMYYNPDEESLNELNEFFVEGCTDWQEVTWGWYRGAAAISDPYKGCYRLDKIEKKPLEFIKLWAKIGSKNINNYIEAIGVFELGFYYPFTTYMPYNSSYMWHTYVDGGFGARDVDGLTDVHIFPKELREKLYKLIIGQKWATIPVLNQFWRGSLTTYIWLITIFFVFVRKKTRYLLPLSFILGLILTVALSPVVLFRYLFPAVICAPIMLYILVLCIKKKA